MPKVFWSVNELPVPTSRYQMWCWATQVLHCPNHKSPRFLALCVAPSHKLPPCSHSTHTTEKGALILTFPSLSQTTIKLISHAHTQAWTCIIWYYSQIIQTLSRQEDKSLSNKPDIKRLGKHLTNSHFLPNFFPPDIQWETEQRAI